MTAEAFQAKHERLLDTYRQTWAEALGSKDTQILRESLLAELGTPCGL